MSQTHVRPFPEPLGPVATRWWQKPVVAIATVLVVTGLTGGIAYAATRGGAAAGTQNETQFPGGGTFGDDGQRGGQGQQGQVPGGSTPGQQQGQQQGQQGQTSRDSSAPST